MPIKVTIQTNSRSARVNALDKRGKLLDSWVVAPDSRMEYLVEGRESLKVYEEGRES